MPRLCLPLAAVALATTALSASFASAQPISGLYIGGGAGINLWHDQSSSRVLIHDQNVGWAVVAAIGWGFGNGLRVEAEGSWRGSNIDFIGANGVPNSGSGRINNFAGMVNALFDFDLSSFGIPPTAVMPYIGAGIGAGWMQIDGARFTNGINTYQINDTGTQFAYQAIAGAAWGLGGLVPGLALTTEYRFYSTLQQDIQVTGTPSAGVPSKLKLDNTNHSFLIGLRYAFNTAPPPAPVAPAPAPAPIARTYLVFFDWDRADLTARAREIIAEAANASRTVQSTRIEVAGHADRSGSAEYNMRLSRRRADNVAAELVRHGVPRTIISISAYGESRPLVPTADGVREPQNRRVEIVLR